MKMTPEHPNWNEFLGDLEISIQKNDCDAETLRLTKRVLEVWNEKKAEVINIEETVSWLESQGAFCDCEISLNI